MKFPFNVIDLTHTISSKIPTWGGERGFNLKNQCTYEDCTTDVKFCVQSVAMNAGIGTHIDAPSHCHKGLAAVHEVSVDQLCSPCVVIDVSDRAHEAFGLTVQDIKEFERMYGELVAGAFVIIRTGWDQFWSHPEKYRNDLRFPAVSEEAARYLLEREIAGLGIDTLSPDRPESGFIVHKLLLGAGKYIVENVANTRMMPAVGGFCIAAPLKIEHGTEAPVRFIGLIPL